MSRVSAQQKGVAGEVREITLAIELVKLGAGLQLPESATRISRDRLINLYKELKGVSPLMGMLLFSTNWFITWQPNIHSSLFYNVYRFMREAAGCGPIQAIVKDYRLYLEHAKCAEDDAVLSLARAWTLVRFFNSCLLTTAPCTRCGGSFVARTHDLQQDFVCGLCAPPPRARKTRKAAFALAD